jgi:hypothetical protein
MLPFWVYSFLALTLALVFLELRAKDYCCSCSCSKLFRQGIYLDLLINKDLSKSRLASV